MLDQILDLQLERLDEPIDALVDRVGCVLSQSGSMTAVLLGGADIA